MYDQPEAVLVSTFRVTPVGVVCSRYVSLASRGGPNYNDIITYSEMESSAQDGFLPSLFSIVKLTSFGVK